MDKVFQVFVSSTFTDLEEERRRVTDTLAKAGHFVAGMELFPATDQQQLDFIKRVIDRSDYYVVVVAGRYGSLSDDGLSFTEKEFQYARSKGIPVLAFIHASPSTIPVGKTDQEADKAEKLEAFKSKLKAGRMVEFWTDPSDLCTKIVIAVSNAINLSPGVGWVRGDQAIDPKVLQESERLRIENQDLRARLATAESTEIVFDDSLLGPDDNITFLVTREISDSNVNDRPKLSHHDVETTAGFIFLSIYDRLLTEPSESQLEGIIGRALSSEIAESKKGSVFRIEEEAVVALRHQLEALDLIEAFGESSTNSTGPFSFTSNYVCWRPSLKGRRYFVNKKAKLRSHLSNRSSNEE
ncbi:DUF4062 domain-containing protein [Tardiphaga alba]|uniref:DUF4062 domain-containing protein n=1 Tax=Tardiphaga alba TaxID=340268 RepID=A0ABX8ADA2_9BRAD|nr:DUF4062 domain-containing protein [Tardiphaga alba]QUS39800.1 DUF4062 domain-containing protein [Tardiphaga alba]